MTALLRFSKMHGAGNDFVLLDCRDAPMPLDAAQVRALSDRHTGIGFDQLLSIEPARDSVSAFAYGIWNADGTPAAQCGNGARCVAAWLHRAGVLGLDLTTPLQSPSGAVQVRVLRADRVAVEMGEPDFHPARIPFVADALADSYGMELAGESAVIGAVSMGNPHAVMVVDDVDDARVERFGPFLSNHARFPGGCNAGFAQIIDHSHIRLRVHERGAGWTRACGSGACAAVAVLRARSTVGPQVHVDLPGGVLDIAWEGPGQRLCMTGAAVFCYAGEWPLS